jgi:glycosyltransferase involved in cell wall biosynthesis
VHTAHLPAPGRLKTPFTITIHDLRHLDPALASLGKRTAARTLIARAVRHAARVITVSETIRSELIERFRADPARVTLVPNAADHFQPLPREPGRDAAILYVGHLEKRKNVDVLLRALALDAELPALVLEGEEVRLRSLARELGVGARVTFLGAFDERDLPRLYARAACAAMPSRIEGFGIPALEAQRAGVPLAISRRPALLEVAGSETPAFAPDDAAEAARAIRAALATPKAALERAAARAARFSWEASAKALVEAWHGAIG